MLRPALGLASGPGTYCVRSTWPGLLRRTGRGLARWALAHRVGKLLMRAQVGGKGVCKAVPGGWPLALVRGRVEDSGSGERVVGRALSHRLGGAPGDVSGGAHDVM